MKKVKKKNNHIKYKKIILIVILSLFFIATIVVLFYGKSRSLNTIMNNSINYSVCDTKNGWKVVYKNGAAYCKNTVASNYSYSCPKGYTMAGGGPTATCQIPTYLYVCPQGYTKYGSGDSTYCQSKKATGYEYYCDSGWTKAGDGPSAYCVSKKATGYEYYCPSGYKKIGNGSSAYCQSKKATGYEYYCPSGYKKIGNGSSAYCQSKKATGYTYSCPSGYAMASGGPSAYCVSKKATHYEYYCPKGWDKRGTGANSICVSKTQKRYYCDPGWTKAGGGPTAYCIKRISKGNYQQRPIRNEPITRAPNKRNGYKTVSTIKQNYYAKSKILVRNAYGTTKVKVKNAYGTTKIKVRNAYAKVSPAKTTQYKTAAIIKTPIYSEYLMIPSYGDDIAGFLIPGNERPDGQYLVSNEPKPWFAINYWTSKLNKNNYVYPKSKNGYPLGAWPKNYYNIPKYISYRAYRGLYVWPTTPVNGVYEFAYKHTGIDIASNFAAPVYSPVDGTMIFSGWGETGNKGSDETSFSVTITPNNTYSFKGVKINEIFLTHMSGIVRRCSWYKCNKKVSKGELIGFVGTANGDSNSGEYAAHLHMTFYNHSNYDGGLDTYNMQELYQITSGTRRSAGQ